MHRRASTLVLSFVFGCATSPEDGDSGPADTGAGSDDDGSGDDASGDDDSGDDGSAELAEPCNPVTFDTSPCDPATATFTLDSTNPFYPLTPGLVVILEGEDPEEGALRVERTVTDEVRTIGGVEVHVLEHRSYIADEIHEIAYNFYVEATDGTVCYFGEDVEFYEGGALANTDGTWRVGEDGAQPGVIMPAMPEAGLVYYQEVAPGNAEDMGRIVEVGATVTYGGVEFTDVVIIQDSNPIDDEEPCHEEQKMYAPGIGEIQDVELTYVSHTEPG